MKTWLDSASNAPLSFEPAKRGDHFSRESNMVAPNLNNHLISARQILVDLEPQLNEFWLQLSPRRNKIAGFLKERNYMIKTRKLDLLNGQVVCLKQKLRDLELRGNDTGPWLSLLGNKTGRTSLKWGYDLEVRELASPTWFSRIWVRQELQQAQVSWLYMLYAFVGCENAHYTLLETSHVPSWETKLYERAESRLNTRTIEVLCLLMGKAFFPPVNWILIQSLHIAQPSTLDRRINRLLPQLGPIIGSLEQFGNYAWTILFLLETLSITALLAVAWNFRYHNRPALYIWSTIIAALMAVAFSRNGSSAAEYFLIGLPLSVSVGMTWANLQRSISRSVKSFQYQVSNQSESEQSERRTDIRKNTMPTTTPEPISDESISIPAPLNSVPECV